MKRDATIDIMKGCCIMLMVFAHAGCAEKLKEFIYLFPMPVFFIASGYFFKPESLRDFCSLRLYFIKRIRRIYIPDLIWGGAFVFLHNWFLRIGIYSSDPSLGGLLSGSDYGKVWSSKVVVQSLGWLAFMQAGLGMGGLAGAFWFLRALFWAGIMYSVVEYCCIKCCDRYRFALQTVFAVTCLIAVRYFNVDIVSKMVMFIGGRQMLEGYALIHLGRVIKATEAFSHYAPPASLKVVPWLCFSLLLEALSAALHKLIAHVWQYPTRTAS